jgi:hypothetical protein
MHVKTITYMCELNYIKIQFLTGFSAKYIQTHIHATNLCQNKNSCALERSERQKRIQEGLDVILNVSKCLMLSY